MNQTLEAMAQAIFKEWCCADDGVIPKDWTLKKLHEVADISSSKRIFMEEYTTNGVPFYRGKEITQLSNGVSISTELFISEERYEIIKEKFGAPQVGDSRPREKPKSPKRRNRSKRNSENHSQLRTRKETNGQRTRVFSKRNGS